MRWLLKVIVGSRAHGLATAESDIDYRGVFQHPTSLIVGMGPKQRETLWVEGDRAAEGTKQDETGWELGHFLHLALQCNPTILEVFAAPTAEDPPLEGAALRSLFDAAWEPRRVRDAFVGYGLNQRKKFLEDKDARGAKYATAYLRVLCQAHHLLTTGMMLVDMTRHEEFERLGKFKRGEFTPGEVIDACYLWQMHVEAVALRCQHAANPGLLNTFLVEARRQYW